MFHLYYFFPQGRCARKTEVALWPHLFAVVGSPGHLFTECLSMKDLETAASYLLILQNLEPPSTAQNHATLLLDASLDGCSWDLAKELVRFLRTIDPEELEEASQHRSLLMASGGGKKGAPQTPPINKSAPEEEISLLLGTLQVPRGRSTSVTQGVKLASPRSSDHKELTRSISEANKTSPGTGKGDGINRSRKASSSSLKDSAGGQTADEFFIDVILQRHARKLLSQVRLYDLGTFAAQLDFHMVAWLKKESTRAARLDNIVLSLKKVHRDFSWPFPILLNVVVNDLKRKQSQESSGSGSGGRTLHHPFKSSHNTQSSFNAIDEKFRALKVDGLTRGHHYSSPSSLGAAAGGAVSDSGYISHNNATTEAASTKDDFSGGDQNILSEQTINAMLRPHAFREDMSMVSDDVASLTTPEDGGHGTNNIHDWSSLQAHAADYAASSHEAASKGPQKSEIQLRYLLQIMLEANCLEIATIISIVLKDALALIRIVNAARTSTDSKVCVMRLFKGIKSLEHWAQTEW